MAGSTAGRVPVSAGVSLRVVLMQIGRHRWCKRRGVLNGIRSTKHSILKTQKVKKLLRCHLLCLPVGGRAGATRMTCFGSRTKALDVHSGNWTCRCFRASSSSKCEICFAATFVAVSSEQLCGCIPIRAVTKLFGGKHLDASSP